MPELLQVGQVVELAGRRWRVLAAVEFPDGLRLTLAPAGEGDDRG